MSNIIDTRSYLCFCPLCQHCNPGIGFIVSGRTYRAHQNAAIINEATTGDPSVERNDCLNNRNRLLSRNHNENDGREFEFVQASSTIAVPVCSCCGQEGHRRTMHRDCLNNPDRLTISNHIENNEDGSDFVQASSTIDVPGHRRTTHRDCLNNPNRLAMRDCNENGARDLEFIHESSEIAVPICSSCGQEGHRRLTHSDCPSNPSNRDESETAHNVAHVSSNTIPQRHFLRSIDNECTYCHARLWIQERVYSSSLIRSPFNICCHFTSLGANIDHTVANAHSGAYNFRIHGSMYHSIGSLLPNENETPAFAQIYVLDNSSAETANRHAVAPVTLNNVVLQQLQNMMHRLNPFVTSFQSMAEVSQTHGIDNVRMVIRSENTPDHRHYNAPTADEIRILIVGNDGDENAGDEGWTIDARSGIHKITVIEWYKYRLMIHGNGREDNYLHRFGKLFQQFIVDMYAKMEDNRLGFIRHNQNRLRADLYRNVADAIHVGDNDMTTVGKRVILPSSFIGPPRHMQQLYQDAMSIV
ncbi:hypothetical protein INT45_004236 [Circinella minor]|uniref:Helitron helicase-like domain-containing protein n=1 Tax=Circinella minor TaxID=1195481 RepID=A0A8H7VI10_9FUNG|nr:hypothetical protein INT45_004236 [Circinella minor]